MGSDQKTKITVKTTVNKPVETVWNKWTNPDDIIKWNNASDDWHTTKAENDLRTGGKFFSRMEAKDGSMGFDFAGVYDNVIVNELIVYSLGDLRKVKVEFTDLNGKTEITETFDAEETNPVEMQRAGWQSILDNFRKYAES
ncbi:MAG TPA: SRPBCC family protein [Ignavibacteria bacterium]|nr:SRPBCC family protein [Ignavibacteria bacterium]HMR41223.1 SRPBCC family protein [Ignavibacteria bacterium]